MSGADAGALRARVAFVTGAASGIGRAIAERFARAGAAVACADLDADGAARVAAALRAEGLRGLGLGADVTDEGSLAAAVGEAVDWGGGLDVAVANAGIMVEGDILSVSRADWERAMAVNATGAFLTARAVLPHLVTRQGALVFTASTVGLTGMRGVAAYSASKGAVVALTRQVAADFADRGVRVNAVAPGAVRTPLSESQFRARAADAAGFEALLGRVAARYPIARWGEAAEIAEAVLFLASEAASWITGQVLPVEGGLLEIRA
jgi:meso-butanediol dehydrogenase/(S,S)-butanediol dehydrogenase/diacetyl reductase